MPATEPSQRDIYGSLEDGLWERYVNEHGRECFRRLQLCEAPDAMLEVWFGDRLPWLRFLRWRLNR